jgi:hypothetical protein
MSENSESKLDSFKSQISSFDSQTLLGIPSIIFPLAHPFSYSMKTFYHGNKRKEKRGNNF